MRIVIVGAGFTGIQLAKLLINEKNQVSLIDNDEETTRHISNQLDCKVIYADGNNLEVLEEAGIAKADALICVAKSDEVNMITCSLVDAVYPDVLKIARVRNYAYYVNTTNAKQKHLSIQNNRSLYGIDYMIHPDVEAAEAIVQAVENGAVGNVVAFENSDLVIARVNVSKNSVFDNLVLKNLREKTDLKFLIAYVEQEGYTSLPSGETIIQNGNTLGVLISKNDVPKILELCGSVQKDLRKVCLIGAGRIGTIIAEKLLQKEEEQSNKIKKLFSRIKTKKLSDFTIIDTNDVLAKAAAEKFSSAKVLCADASDESFLKEEGITSYDLAICVTHNHELNMVLAAYLESLGVGQSISLVQSSPFATIAEKLGVDVAIPLRDCVVDSIMSHLRGKAVKEVHTVTTGELEIVECEITKSSKVAGLLLKDIKTDGTFLVLLNKKKGEDKYLIANGNTQIFSGDHVVLITNSESSQNVLMDFAGKE